jgi:5-(carboxyamino)imidazole ribonucleotide mutase
MPPGIPVATVGIGNGKNAGYLAAHIVAIADPAVREKLVAYRKGLGDIEG